MAAPYGNLRSKLNRAVCAYLVSMGCGTNDDVFPQNTGKKKEFPNTTTKGVIAQEDPPFSGTERIQLRITLKGKAVQSVETTDSETERIEFDNRVATTNDALRQTDNSQDLRATALDITTAGRALAVDASNGADPVQVQFAANNADMVDFTCQGWFPRGSMDGEPEDEGCDWMEILIFEAVCSPSNVD